MRMNYIYLKLRKDNWITKYPCYRKCMGVYWETLDGLTLSKLDAISALIKKHDEIKHINNLKGGQRFAMASATGAGLINAEKNRYFTGYNNRKFPDFIPEYKDMEHGYICLTRYSQLYYEHMADRVITINHLPKMTIDYSDMFEKVDKNEYLKNHDISFQDILAIGVNPKKISTDRWEYFKKCVLENEVFRYGNTCYLRIE